MLIELQIVISKTKDLQHTGAAEKRLGSAAQCIETISDDYATGLINLFGLKFRKAVPATRFKDNTDIFDYYYS